MSLDPIKPIGGFIENTIRPMLEEMKWFFKECERLEIPINESNIKSVVDYIVKAHIRSLIIKAIQTIIITVLICLTWSIYR